MVYFFWMIYLIAQVCPMADADRVIGQSHIDLAASEGKYDTMESRDWPFANFSALSEHHNLRTTAYIGTRSPLVKTLVCCVDGLVRYVIRFVEARGTVDLRRFRKPRREGPHNSVCHSRYRTIADSRVSLSNLAFANTIASPDGYLPTSLLLAIHSKRSRVPNLQVQTFQLKLRVR